MKREEKQAITELNEAQRQAEMAVDAAWNAEARLVDYPASAAGALWRAVVGQAVDDALRGRMSEKYDHGRESNAERADARIWLTSHDDDFEYVCGLAALEPDAVRARAREFEGMGWEASRAVRAA